MEGKKLKRYSYKRIKHDIDEKGRFVVYSLIGVSEYGNGSYMTTMFSPTQTRELYEELKEYYRRKEDERR